MVDRLFAKGVLYILCMHIAHTFDKKIVTLVQSNVKPAPSCQAFKSQTSARKENSSNRVCFRFEGNMRFWLPTESAIFFSIRYKIAKSQIQFMNWRFLFLQAPFPASPPSHLPLLLWHASCQEVQQGRGG